MIITASCFRGSIKAFGIAPGQEMILQKVLILPVRMGLSYLHSLIKKDRAGLFGGGLLCRKASGHGIMFAEFGHVVEYELDLSRLL